MVCENEKFEGRTEKNGRTSTMPVWPCRVDSVGGSISHTLSVPSSDPETTFVPSCVKAHEVTYTFLSLVTCKHGNEEIGREQYPIIVPMHCQQFGTTFYVPDLERAVVRA